MNEGYRLVPWADILYACDARWWKARDGVPGFGGTKVSPAIEALRIYQDINVVRIDKGRDKMLVDDPGLLGDGGNSGFQAINLVAQAGARRIVLIGFDFRIDHGSHWHGLHGRGLDNPVATNLIRWRGVLDDAAPTFAALGIEVINASPVSLLSAYPRMSVDEALG